jgi:hypothetical protein
LTILGGGKECSICFLFIAWLVVDAAGGFFSFLVFSQKRLLLKIRSVHVWWQ